MRREPSLSWVHSLNPGVRRFLYQYTENLLTWIGTWISTPVTLSEPKEL